MVPRYLGNRMVLGAALVILLSVLFGFGAFQFPKAKEVWYSQRVTCKQGCNSTACKRASCGDNCKGAPCRGCWKKSETAN